MSGKLKPSLEIASLTFIDDNANCSTINYTRDDNNNDDVDPTEQSAPLTIKAEETDTCSDASSLEEPVFVREPGFRYHAQCLRYRQREGERGRGEAGGKKTKTKKGDVEEDDSAKEEESVTVSGHKVNGYFKNKYLRRGKSKSLPMILSKCVLKHAQNG